MPWTSCARPPSSLRGRHNRVGKPRRQVQCRAAPLVGLDDLVRLLEGLFSGLTREPPVLVEGVWINGLPGCVNEERDSALQTTALQIVDGQIASNLHHP